MASELPLTLQTAYAELLDRCASAAFQRAFTEEGAFTSKTVRGRRYWYFQARQEDGTRKQRYVGPETPVLLERIESHTEARGEQRDRRAIVSMLVRSARLPRPEARIGQIVEVLADAGVFRLRGVLVGTVAYQTYAAMLGIRLPAAAVLTGDVDIAQFQSISVAVEESAPAVLETLQKVDPSFRAVPQLDNRRGATSYQGEAGLRVDFLTPNEGADTDAPASLPALGTAAQPLRFLDFLIHEPEPAVLLHGEGVYALVPSPQRFAVRKLIVARRRQVGAAKTDNDLQQATALLDVLVRKRPHELEAVWGEAMGRGPRWRQLIGEGIGLIDLEVREAVLKAVNAPRSITPGLDLAFSAPKARYESERDIVSFTGSAAGRMVRCAVTSEALADHFSAQGADQDSTVRAFRENRSVLEQMARTKYLTWPVEEVGGVIIKSDEVEALRAEAQRPARG